MLGVGDDFGVWAFVVFEGAVEVVTDSVTSSEVSEPSVEVLITWCRVDVELSVAAEEGAREVLFAAPKEAEPSATAESDRFHCGKKDWRQ